MTTRHLPQAPTGIRPLSRGAGASAHRHDNAQLISTRSGVVTVTTEAGVWLAFPGRGLWVPGGVVHEHRAFGAADLLLVGIPPSDAPPSHPPATATNRPSATPPSRPSADPPSTLSFAPPGHRPANPPSRFPTDPPDRRPADPLRHLTAPAVVTLDPLLRELVHTLTAEPDVDGPERARLLTVLLDRLRRAPRPAGQYVPAARDPRLAAACRILLDDPSERAGLAELGARVGAGERTLSRLFARELGMGFPRWRASLRLHHALILLAEGVPVTTVAHRCGWSSASAFIDAYRRAFGHTPGAARLHGWPG